MLNTNEPVASAAAGACNVPTATPVRKPIAAAEQLAAQSGNALPPGASAAAISGLANSGGGVSSATPQGSLSLDDQPLLKRRKTTASAANLSHEVRGPSRLRSQRTSALAAAATIKGNLDCGMSSDEPSGITVAQNQTVDAAAVSQRCGSAHVLDSSLPSPAPTAACRAANGTAPAGPGSTPRDTFRPRHNSGNNRSANASCKDKKPTARSNTVLSGTKLPKKTAKRASQLVAEAELSPADLALWQSSCGGGHARGVQAWVGEPPAPLFHFC